MIKTDRSLAHISQETANVFASVFVEFSQCEYCRQNTSESASVQDRYGFGV